MLFDKEPCQGCGSKDEHISSLKQQIESLQVDNNRLTNHIFELESEHVQLLQHLTGMRRTSPNTPGEFKSMPRQGSIQQRIARAERASHEEAAPVITKRNKEYDERINSLLNPEVEVAIQEGSSK